MRRRRLGWTAAGIGGRGEPGALLLRLSWVSGTTCLFVGGDVEVVAVRGGWVSLSGFPGPVE